MTTGQQLAHHGTIVSDNRVTLTWPASGSAIAAGFQAPTLAEIEAAFAEWIGEARRRGCPETAPVATFGRGNQLTDTHLLVQWNEPEATA